MFDTFYIGLLNNLKPKFGKKAMGYALYYINITEVSFYALVGCFFAAFANQLNIGKLSTEKALTVTVLFIFFICLKNWMRYNGKRRNVLNAKSKRVKLKFWKLILLPIACIILAIVFFQAI